ncbi:hypothetical protein C8R44DRAFT_643658, partial [Mycena epipterygia]
RLTISSFLGAFLVDVFPAMLYIPELLAPFKRTARVWALATKNMVEAPFLFVRREMVCSARCHSPDVN